MPETTIPKCPACHVNCLQVSCRKTLTRDPETHDVVKAETTAETWRCPVCRQDPLADQDATAQDH